MVLGRTSSFSYHYETDNGNCEMTFIMRRRITAQYEENQQLIQWSLFILKSEITTLHTTIDFLGLFSNSYLLNSVNILSRQ